MTNQADRLAQADDEAGAERAAILSGGFGQETEHRMSLEEARASGGV